MNVAEVNRQTSARPWTTEVAVLVTLAPLVAAGILVWQELSATRGTAGLSFLAGAIYFLSPTIGALAARRTARPVSPQRIVALLGLAFLAWNWIAFVERPTRPGVFFGGTGVAPGLVYAMGGSLVWYWSSRRASYWIDRGWRGVAVVVAGAFVIGGSAFVITAAVSLPLP